MTTLFSNRYCLFCKTTVVYLHMLKAHTIPLNNTVDGPTEYETCYGPFVDKEPSKHNYFVSRDSVEAAKKLLSEEADGSKANEQARSQAVLHLEEYCRRLTSLIELNPKSFAALSMEKEMREIENIIIEVTDGNDDYDYSTQKNFD